VAYKLEHLDQLVMDANAGSLGMKFVLSQIETNRILHEALQETEKLKALLIREVFSFNKEKEIEIYIKNYQTSLTHLLDRLYFQQKTLKESSEDSIHFYQGLFQMIQALLSFIEERFSKYFDRSAKVPAVYLALTREEIHKKLTTLDQVLQKNYQGDKISGQIFQRLTAFGESPEASSYTYRDIMFYKELVKELEDLDQWVKGQNMYSSLEQLLIYINYNDKDFINTMVNRLSLELDSIDDFNGKIDRLLIYSKEINQLQLKPDSSFLARHPSVKNQLSNWLAEELAYLERKLKGFQLVRPSSSANTESTRSKVTCHLPVDQLGILFRAATDIHIINSSSQKALFDQIVPWLSTTHRMVLSAESMRSKSYSPEKRDQEALKDILMQLFRRVGEY
jgi:hypothetical protein